MHVGIINIGDELLIGETVNTNAAWLGAHLTTLGARVERIAVVGDDKESIRAELARSLENSDVVIMSGGLGPTHDDITRAAVARHFGVELVMDERLWEQIARRFERRGRTPAPSNRRQAMVPKGFQVLDNKLGTAPGLWFETLDQQVVVVLPGVPRELQALMEEQVLPRLRKRHDLAVIKQRVLRTAGIGESSLQEVIGDLSEWLSDEHLRLAYLPHTDGVRLRLTATGSTEADAQERVDEFESVLRDRIGRHIYGVGEESIEEVVGRLLREHGATLASAESCTGGLLASRITDIPGASAYFQGGAVCYSNQAKIDLLGVEEDVLRECGAVSREVAEQMATGARARFAADFGVAITGIAGPSGGTSEKPVGTVWIAIAREGGVRARKYQLTQDRLYNKEISCTLALDAIRRLQALGEETTD